MKPFLIKFLLPMAVFAALTGCFKKSQENSETAANKFSNPEVVQVYQWQDKRQTDSLLLYLDDERAAYRTEATLALASVQDSAALPGLSRLVLEDSSNEVRRAAAFALGQLKNAAAEEPLAQALSQEKIPVVRCELLEALGKCITQEHLSLLRIGHIRTDSMEWEGLAWGFYRAGIRNVHDDSITQVVISLLDTAYTYRTRLGAAHYLAQSPHLDLNPYVQKIIHATKTDPAATVRMACASALGKVPSKKALEQLKNSILHDSDHRVRVNALKSLEAFDLDLCRAALGKALSDENINVRVAAAQTIRGKSLSKDIPWLQSRADSSTNYRVRSLLLGALVRLDPDPSTRIEAIKAQFQATEHIYEKAALLEALSHSLKAYPFIVTETYGASHPAISTAGVMALVSLRKRPDFPDELAEEFADIFKTIIDTDDLAMIGLVSELVAHPDMGFKKYYTNPDFLLEARKKLSLPRDNEALQSLEKAIAFIQGIPLNTVEVKNSFNHPIDWTAVAKIPKGQQVSLHTEKGEITIELLVEDAPGSVMNFVSLVKEGYFDGKNFHRVAPNFVVQGGCHRGDGWGSEDYSIRSEFTPIHYDTGHIGMASAGKDTEGTQWFITHSPTPHLDGRYTIFAKVIDGMKVTHQLEVGDRILKMELL